jgi:WD40 repeat protein
LAFIGRGEEVISAARDGTIKKWACGTGDCVTTVHLPSGSANCLALNSDRLILAAGTETGSVCIYDTNSKNLVCEWHFMGMMNSSLDFRSIRGHCLH